jgi:hypothetical protein
METGLVRRFALLAAGVAVIPVITFASLVVADWRETRHQVGGAVPALVRVFDAGDRLHYVWHLGFGRLFALCPCTERLATEQYERAEWHTRTARQQALITSERPRTLPEELSDIAEIAASGLRWGQDGALWLLARLTRT